VAPFSRVYRIGEQKAVQTLTVELPPEGIALTRTISVTASKPRVKAGINITALSMADRMKMMRGELGTKKEVFTGSADEAARRIMSHAQLDSTPK
jgi:hypothetical protein